ncbi:hypothetical protein DBR11_06300 [Pedobacter sp. HMWF019]|uniref:P63C domain-containing protein n=1 Tax=Pedobacter sp. HMWF019 TaxID=2056856 RepID=UPI000D354AC0|nr:P63C domain-containing protein [Pedobacter sp. HMWF019]PTT01903.1 hypothetical protein DBR11_06300 [Pedobacter sp. HMWF019]
MAKKTLKAEYGSDKTPLIIGSIEIPCYVLTDGTRVLSRNGMQKAIGYEGTSGDWLVKFVGGKNISTHIKPEIIAGLSEVIKFKRNNAGGSQSMTYGYEATKLIDFCDALIDLKKSGVLKDNQIIYADQAEIIIRSVAKVGIIALVDEVTGYQYDRERDALQTILKAYISDELLSWQKTFPDTYYREIFRLNGWGYTVSDIKRRPGIVGKWTNRIIYDQLPKGILEELKKNTPKSAAGNYTARFFQSLTSDTGHPHLSAQLNQVIAVMRISDNWKQFITHFNKMVDRKNGQLELGLDDLAPE